MAPPLWTITRTGNLCGQRFPDIFTTRTNLYIRVGMASHDTVQQSAASDIPAVSVTTIQVRVYLVTV